MSRVPYLAFLFLTGGLLITSAVLCESTVLAQGKDKFTTPKVVTTDGVRLNVLFYASPKKNSPAVIMLHPVGVGESINQPGWKALAEKLQENNYSVAIFDFRGHGESKAIESPEEFWWLPDTTFPNGKIQKNPNNINLKNVKKSNKEGDTIDVKDYIKAAYLPVLINDIAAVKAFLDKRNDAGECNTANTIVIGTDNGATLGAIWINSQWSCYKYTLPPMVGLIKPQPVVDKRAEGNDIHAAVWLNISPTLGIRNVALSTVLKKACYEHAMPSAFFYGEEDAKAKKFAKTATDALKPKGSKKHDYILPVEIAKTKLSGVELLKKGLKTNEIITEYLDSLTDKREDWTMRNYTEAAFGWRSPPGSAISFVPAKRKDQKILKFDTYERFISQ